MQESAFDHDKDLSDTDSCIYEGVTDTGHVEGCEGFDDTDGGHLPHIHSHLRYNYLPMTRDMAEVSSRERQREMGRRGEGAEERERAEFGGGREGERGKRRRGREGGWVGERRERTSEGERERACVCARGYSMCTVLEEECGTAGRGVLGRTCASHARKRATKA